MTFIDDIKAKALNLYYTYNILPSLTIAQACLESGYGKHAPGNNLFGFKWTSGCGYDYQELPTYEFINGKYVKVLAKFRKYDSLNDSLDDYGKLIGTRPRYKAVIESPTFIEATTEIRNAGYATSPKYTENLNKVILTNKLYRYDYHTNPDMQITKNFKWIESFSAAYVNGKRYYRIIEPPVAYKNNAINVLKNLQIIREHYNKPTTISYTGCLYRTEAYNSIVGGAKLSQHKLAKAADIIISNIKPYNIYLYAKDNTDFKGYGIGKNYIHVDLRPMQAIWFY